MIPIRNTQPLRWFNLILAMTIALLCSVSASAQNYPAQNSYQANGYVTVFEECNFQGKSRNLAVGDYPDVRNLNIGNDSVSSVQVPYGVRLTLFKDERFSGGSTTLDENVTCLDQNWNNQASSLRVTHNNQGQNNSGQDQNNSGQYQNNPWPQQGEQYTGPNAAKVAKIMFANTALEKNANQQWRIVNPNGNVEIYREINRDARTISLQRNRGPGRVQVDLLARNVQFQSATGQLVNYKITDIQLEQLEQLEQIEQLKKGNDVSADRTGHIQKRCFKFKAYALGGEGAVKFYGHNKSFQFRKKPKKGSICHDGNLTMEINKTLLSTEVVVEIEGRKYKSLPNEEADAFKNNWYRKVFKLKVGKG